MHDIRSWADIVTAHRISGPDIVEGIAAGWADVARIGGVLLAQMSSSGNLLNADYTDEVIATGRGSPNVIGFIGNSSSAEEVAALRAKVGDSQMIWTPELILQWVMVRWVEMGIRKRQFSLALMRLLSDQESMVQILGKRRQRSTHASHSKHFVSARQ